MAQLASCCFFSPYQVFFPFTPPRRLVAVWYPEQTSKKNALPLRYWMRTFHVLKGRRVYFLDSTATSQSLLKIAKMLSLTCRRTLCSQRTLLPLKRMMTNRYSSHIAAICSAHHFRNDISSSRNDLSHCNTNFITSGNQRQGIILTKSVGSLRNYCAGPVSQNCWNCKQPLDKTPAFFCLSCNVVQPPEEGTSYFKIMDW